MNAFSSCRCLLDGRLMLTQSGDQGSESVVLKYQLLNPSHHFKEIVDAARCVVLAGGTMSPVRQSSRYQNLCD